MFIELENRVELVSGLGMKELPPGLTNLLCSPSADKSSSNVNDDQLYAQSRASCNGAPSSGRNLKQSRFGSVSQLLQVSQRPHRPTTIRVAFEQQSPLDSETLINLKNAVSIPFVH